MRTASVVNTCVLCVLYCVRALFCVYCGASGQGVIQQHHKTKLDNFVIMKKHKKVDSLKGE